MAEPVTDLLVVGAGAAGLFAALTAARSGARVTLVSATPLAQAASYWAQGGMAASLALDDTPDKHIEDTLIAGRNLVREAAARVLCHEAPGRFFDLEAAGVRFDRDRHGNLALGLEGGHSARRVAHAGGSATGRRILRQLSAVVVGMSRMEVLERSRAAHLWLDDDGRCVGLITDDGRPLIARATLLATGGAAALWSRTTNPPGSFGSGLLLARAAGAELADLEFMQFHPTAVIGIPGREGFLVTEAVRGEGAKLTDVNGERFADELAPRDEVARAIHRTLQESGAKAVLLDMRGLDPGRFPNVVGALQDAGHDPMTKPIPVAPASHYGMGGVVTDLQGRTEGVPGLYAVGEVACTGLHGANRLASNSLSECFVFGQRAALAGLDEPVPDAARLSSPPPDGQIAVAPTRQTRRAMWENAGLVRDAERLRTLLDDPHPLARLVAESALEREESRGAHQRTEFPETDHALDLRHAVVARDGARRLEHWE